MAPFGTIYSYPGNHRVQRAQVIAELNKLELAVPGPSEFQFGVTNKTPEFLAKFPLGKVPAFEGADGFTLTEGGAIATYLAGAGPLAGQLLGSDRKAQAKVAEWTLFTETELVANSNPALYVFLKFAPADPAKLGDAAARFARALARVEAAVTAEGGRKFLVGDALTLADLMVAPVLFYTAGFLLDEEMAKAAPGTVAYLKGIAATPEFAKYFGSDFKPCEKRVGA